PRSRCPTPPPLRSDTSATIRPRTSASRLRARRSRLPDGTVAGGPHARRAGRRVASRGDLRHGRRLHREGDRCLPARHAAQSRPSGGRQPGRRLTRRVPAAREGRRVPRALARRLRDAQADGPRRAGEDRLPAAGRVSHVQEGAPAHGAGAEQLVPAHRPQPADVRAEHQQGERKGLQGGDDDGAAVEDAGVEAEPAGIALSAGGALSATDAAPPTDDAQAIAGWGRLLLTLLLVPLSWHAFHDPYGEVPLLSGIDLAIHEFGHMLFMPFGIAFLGRTM